MSNFKLIIGIVGTIGAGKSSAVDYLVSKGFGCYKFSDIIIERYSLRNPSRSTLQDKGNELRKKFGNDFLAKEIWRKIENSKSKRAVLDGLRNIGEVEFFRGKEDFALVAIEADQEARFKRLKNRSIGKDPEGWKEFLELEERDLDEGVDFGQQNKAVMQLADLTMKNDGTLEELHSKIDSVLKSLYESSRKNPK